MRPRRFRRNNDEIRHASMPVTHLLRLAVKCWNAAC